MKVNNPQITQITQITQIEKQKQLGTGERDTHASCSQVVLL
jgi:hypothetical protein